MKKDLTIELIYRNNGTDTTIGNVFVKDGYRTDTALNLMMSISSALQQHLHTRTAYSNLSHWVAVTLTASNLISGLSQRSFTSILCDDPTLRNSLSINREDSGEHKGILNAEAVQIARFTNYNFQTVQIILDENDDFFYSHRLFYAYRKKEGLLDDNWHPPEKYRNQIGTENARKEIPFPEFKHLLLLFNKFKTATEFILIANSSYTISP